MSRRYLIKAFLKGLLISMGVILLLTLFGIDLSGYRLAAIVYATVFVTVEIRHYKTNKKKQKEYISIDNFLSAVRHRYFAHGMVDEAIQEVSDDISDPYMRRESEEILRVLFSTDCKSALAMYRKRCTNRYLNLFTSLCITVMEYGDANYKEGSLFLYNLMSLKEELRNEIEADKQLYSKMTGMGFVSVAPALCLEIIKKWSVGNLPELEQFYEGSGGKTLMAALFLTSIIIYSSLCIFRGVRINEKGRMEILHKLSLLPGIHAFLYKTEKRFKRASKGMQKLIYDAGEEISVKELYLEKILIGISVLLLFCATNLINVITKESSLSMIFVLVVTIFAYFLPNLFLFVKKLLNRMGMEEEIMQYQSIISMLMFIDRISIYEILEELEQFARIFKKSISNCLNEFNSGEEKALEALGNEGCEALKNISEKMLLCDQIGVRKAFDEINADHEYYMKKREKENERSIHRKAVLGQFIAFIPLLASVLLYLIVPFAKASLEMLMKISEGMNL